MAGPPFESRTSVITCDTQGIVQEYAADAADLFGWTQDEVIGKMSVAMFHVPKNVPTLVPRLLREAVEKGKFEEEVVLMRKDGSTFRAVLTVRPILRDGQHVGYMGMTRPLTPPGPVPVARLWVQSLRAPFLVASLIPGFVGALAAREAGYGIDLGLLGLALVGLAVACFLVSPPLRLAHRGVGEIAVGIAFGPVTVLGVYYVLTRAIDPPAVVLSLSLGLLVSGILWINEIPDIPADAAVGKRTLVVRLGVARATTAFGAIVLAAYAILVLGVVLFSMTPWALLALLAIPLPIQPILGLPRGGADPRP